MSSVIVLWRYSNAAAVHSAHREYMWVQNTVLILINVWLVIRLHQSKSFCISLNLFIYSPFYLSHLSVLSSIFCVQIPLILIQNANPTTKSSFAMFSDAVRRFFIRYYVHYFLWLISLNDVNIASTVAVEDKEMWERGWMDAEKCGDLFLSR